MIPVGRVRTFEFVVHGVCEFFVWNADQLAVHHLQMACPAINRAFLAGLRTTKLVLTSTGRGVVFPSTGLLGVTLSTPLPRLRLVLPELQQKLQEAEAREFAAQWEADYLHGDAVCNKAAENFATRPKLFAEIFDIYREREAVNAS